MVCMSYEVMSYDCMEIGSGKYENTEGKMAFGTGIASMVCSNSKLGGV